MTDQSSPVAALAALAPPPLALTADQTMRRAVDALLLDWVSAALKGETRVPPRLGARIVLHLARAHWVRRLLGVIVATVFLLVPPRYRHGDRASEL